MRNHTQPMGESKSSDSGLLTRNQKDQQKAAQDFSNVERKQLSIQNSISSENRNSLWNEGEIKAFSDERKGGVFGCLFYVRRPDVKGQQKGVL